jgi:predicted Rossmann fold nucleotide-binding protein DprA/Smf involved in DNA uptake
MVEPFEAPSGLPGRVLAQVAFQPASIDELARSLHFAPGDVAAALIELELAGRVSEGDGVYRATVVR